MSCSEAQLGNREGMIANDHKVVEEELASDGQAPRVASWTGDSAIKLPWQDQSKLLFGDPDQQDDCSDANSHESYHRISLNGPLTALK